MRKNHRRIAALSLGLMMASLTACASPETKLPSLKSAGLEAEAHQQRMIALKADADALTRVRDVAYRVMTANASECGTQVGPSFGFHAVNLEAYDKKERAAAAELWPLNAHLRVSHVVPDTAAANAGIETGDELVRVDGRPVPVGEGAVARLAEMLARHADGSTAEIVYRRGQSERTATLKPVTMCNFPVEVKASPAPNAFTDGDRITINQGAVAQAKNDQQLAMIVSHELAHVTKRHNFKQLQNGLVAGAGGAVVDGALTLAGIPSAGTFGRLAMGQGKKAYSEEFEQEADYVGLYYMAKAGYSSDGIEAFWRTMGGGYSHGFAFSGGQSSSVERYMLVRATQNEIEAKQMMGMALEPNLASGEPLHGSTGTRGNNYADER